MKVAIDATGRLVVPKPLRTELGLTGAAERELQVADGRLEATVPDASAWVEERDGLPIIVADDWPGPPLTTAQTRAAIDRVRR
jgi:bifunctional DNA-binding transcriptional regulator/antitoxin component of YhaV-PrlF toxin-antitoxin module